MDISGLRSFATWARVVLSRQVQARITAVLAPGSTTRVKHPAAISALEHAIADTSHDQVIERVAYTWFNRIIALRFMDANGYTSLGVVSPSPTSPGQPEILAHAKRGLTDPDIITPTTHTTHTTHTTVMALLDGTRTSPDSVGCMFGRYSFDEPGLILADQVATLEDCLKRVPEPTFLPDADNVLPIVDGDWFEDDLVARFRTFLRAAFGDDHFEENLQFVTKALGVRDIRYYFVKSFYKDHVKRYKNRPIYWLFSSPKGSFNALIYMHRYTPSTVSTVLKEYLREYQAKLRASLETAERAGNSREAERLRKILVELNEYEHDVLYPLATKNLAIDLDDGVKVNYPKFGTALKKIPGLEASQ